MSAWVGDVLDIGLEAEVVSDLVFVEEFDGGFVFAHGDVLIGVAGLKATAEEGVGETQADDILIAAGEEAFVDESAAVVFLDGIAVSGGPAELEEGAESLIVIRAIALFEEHLVAGEEEAVVLVEGAVGIVEVDPKIVARVVPHAGAESGGELMLAAALGLPLELVEGDGAVVS